MEVIKDEKIVNPVPVVVTNENKAAVKDVLGELGEVDESKVKLPVDGNGTNIEAILEISKEHKAANVQVPDVIIIKDEAKMEMTGAEVVTLENIAKAAKEGGSGAKLTLDLEVKDLNVQNAVSILGNIDATIKTTREPGQLIITM